MSTRRILFRVVFMSFLFFGIGFRRPEEVAETREAFANDESDAGFGNFAFEDAFVSGVPEESDVHVVAFVEHVFDRDVVDEVLP